MQEITTDKKWNDLLSATAINNLKQLLHNWIQNKTIHTDKPGKQQAAGLYLYGGNTEKRKSIAALAGMHTGQKVYTIDRPAIGADYIGETEKKLLAVFTEAEQNNWILFFDEADALFGKRSAVKDSHNKFAHTSLLLQKIEACNTPLILSGDAALTDEPFPQKFFAVIDCTA